MKNPEARAFNETEAHRSGWSVRQLDRQIGSQFYERIALSKNKAAMLEKAEKSESTDLVTPEEAIKDPFVLEFLGLKDQYSESDLEEALIQKSRRTATQWRFADNNEIEFPKRFEIVDLWKDTLNVLSAFRFRLADISFVADQNLCGISQTRSS